MCTGKAVQMADFKPGSKIVSEADQWRDLYEAEHAHAARLAAALRRIAEALDDPSLTEEELADVVNDLTQGVLKEEEAK
jgi:hypothetical protein